ncbi:MAG: helix-turn-helix domain-containing protein [Alistipes shahii]
MNEPVIVTTPAQLQSIISDAVNAILPKLADFRRKNEPVETDGMTVEDAARFLTAQGIPTTRASLYNLVYKNTIPHKKFGRRTVFSKKNFLRGSNRAPCVRRTSGPPPHCVSPRVPTVNNPGAMKQKEQAPALEASTQGQITAPANIRNPGMICKFCLVTINGGCIISCCRVGAIR